MIARCRIAVDAGVLGRGKLKSVLDTGGVVTLYVLPCLTLFAVDQVLFLVLFGEGADALDFVLICWGTDANFWPASVLGIARQLGDSSLDTSDSRLDNYKRKQS